VLAMLAKVLRLASVIICLIVALSFIVFAVNQTKSASGHQREVLGESSSAVHNGKATSKESSVHKALDEAFYELTSPFSGIVSSSSEWVDRTVRLILALLVYGFGLGYLARVLRVRV
jgi:hypothetical protein